MAWFIVAIIGAFIGVLMSFLVRHLEMPQFLCVGLGIVGALVGSGLNAMVGTEVLGAWSFYLSGAIMSICLLSGGILAYSLTQEEHRI